MAFISNMIFFICVLFIINLVSTSPVPGETGDKKEEVDSLDEESNKKDLGTVSPTEMENLVKQIIDKQEENVEKFQLNATVSPEEVSVFLAKEEAKYGSELPETIEVELTTSANEFKNLVQYFALFNKIKSEASGKEEKVVEKSPAEMKEMKKELFKLVNELNEKAELPKISHKEFDEAWNQQKEEHGKKFPMLVEKVIDDLKKTEPKEEASAPVEDTEPAVETTTTEVKEEPPKGTFVLRNKNGQICILAKFNSTIIITYPGKTSELKVEVNIPSSSLTEGKCANHNRSLQLSWEKFMFTMSFNKTSEDSWAVTSMKLNYDTSGPLFDGAAEQGKVIAKSKKINLFETPLGKSYVCPGHEIIRLFNGDVHVATIRLDQIHLQAYDVEDGKFSSGYHCSQVVIEGSDEEPFVPDETVPLAVGCTLALITLLILVGFSVHRAYNAAKVDYNSME